MAVLPEISRATDMPPSDERHKKFSTNVHQTAYPESTEHPAKSLIEVRAQNLRELFYPNRSLKFPLPLKGYIKLPVPKGSVFGTMGFGALLFTPAPLNYIIGFPTIGLGCAVEYIPRCKTKIGKYALGTTTVVSSGLLATIGTFCYIINILEKYKS